MYYIAKSHFLRSSVVASELIVWRLTSGTNQARLNGYGANWYRDGVGFHSHANLESNQTRASFSALPPYPSIAYPRSRASLSSLSTWARSYVLLWLASSSSRFEQYFSAGILHLGFFILEHIVEANASVYTIHTDNEQHCSMIQGNVYPQVLFNRAAHTYCTCMCNKDVHIHA